MLSIKVVNQSRGSFAVAISLPSPPRPYRFCPLRSSSSFALKEREREALAVVDCWNVATCSDRRKGTKVGCVDLLPFRLLSHGSDHAKSGSQELSQVVVYSLHASCSIRAGVSFPESRPINNLLNLCTLRHLY